VSLAHPADRLARSAPTEATDALAILRDLVVRARELHPDGTCDPAVCAGQLALHDPSLCALAIRLARLAVPGSVAALPASDAVLRWPRFAAAIVAAGEAVRICRQTAHPTGGCWFGEDPSACREVLRWSHHLSSALPSSA
jgi:hypothetical protein